MAAFKYLKNNFNAGKLTPLLDARHDFKGHKNGCEDLLNTVSLAQGGTRTRPGSIFCHEVKDSSKVTKLVPFEYNVDQAYTLEFGEYYVRFMTDSGLITEADLTITGITKADPCVITSTAHGLTDGDQIYISDTLGMTEVNDDKLFYTVANKTANTFELQDRDAVDIDSTAYTTYSSAGTINKIYEVTTPYTESDVADLQHTQSTDTMTLFHGSYAPRQLTRLTTSTFSVAGMMKDTADTSATLVFGSTPFLPRPAANTAGGGTTFSAAVLGAATMTVTASSTNGINADSGFQSGDLGRLIRWVEDGSSIVQYLEIYSVTSTTVVLTNRVDTSLGIPSACDSWAMGSWSNTTGFPITGTYHQARLVVAGNQATPETVYHSGTSDFVNFDIGVNDSDPFYYSLGGTTSNKIYWLASSDELRVGTNSGIWSVKDNNASTGLTPLNNKQAQENQFRCSSTASISLGKITLYLQRSGRVLRELVYSFERDGLVSPDLTVLSEDVLGNEGDLTDLGGIDLAYQLEPSPAVWVIKHDGNVASLNYLREQDIVGWHDHTIGGSGLAESVSVMPITGQDRVFFIIKRTINGVTRRYVEKLDTTFRGKTAEEAKVCDSSFTVTGDTFATTLTPAATTGDGIVFTASASTFVSGDVGRIIRFGSSFAEITTYTSATVVEADISVDFPDTSAIAAGSWNLSIDTLSGLDYLEGMTVSILGDGGVVPAQVVTSGAISLLAPRNMVTIGLGFTQTVTMMPTDFGGADGVTSIGGRYKVNEVVLDLFESSGGLVGYEVGDATEIIFRQGDDPLGQGSELFTGNKYIKPIVGYVDSLKVTVTETDPLPITIRSILIKGQVDDRKG